MFGISISEFLVILVIAIAVIPARDWPTVAKWLARAVKVIRDLIWKITDATESIREQIDLERPIDEISKNTIEGVRAAFATPKQIVKSRGKAVRSLPRPRVKRAATPSLKRRGI